MWIASLRAELRYLLALITVARKIDLSQREKEEKMTKNKRLLIAIILFYFPILLNAGARDNALEFFKFAEANYPELLNPMGPETQEIQGYYVRYYENTQIYLGVQGDNVWAVGGSLGDEVKLYGKLKDFIALQETDISGLMMTNRRPLCADYADTSFSAVRDVNRNVVLNGNILTTVEGKVCLTFSW